MSTYQNTYDWDSLALGLDYDPEFDVDFDEAFAFDLEAAEAAPVTVPDLAVLAHSDYAERSRLLDAYVRQEIGRVLGVAPESVDTTGRPMNSLGVGSINGMELQARMEAALGVELKLQSLLRANSAAELVDCLARQLGPGDGPSQRSAAPAATV
ncbi:acyl carrier protein [Streptomyces albireticuli]|nr:acyl carrier protein [Streptomyces albireticuli]MCD9196494.1 acyl carrier protein [Streptomyces albireticuli]